MRPQVVTVGPLVAASANNIATTQAVVGASAVVLNGSTVTNGVAVLDKPRRVLITSAGNDVGILFTIAGTNWSGQPITELVTGPNATSAASALDYATVTSIRTSGSTAAAITVGTNGVAATSWVRLNEYGTPQTIAQADVVGTVSGTLQSTLDDPNDPTNPVPAASITWINSSDAGAVNFTGNIQSTYTTAPRWVRGLLNSGSGSISLTVQQMGGIEK